MMQNPLVGQEEVRATMCIVCGGIPEADWLPFWTYDEFGGCTCEDEEDEEAELDGN